MKKVAFVLFLLVSASAEAGWTLVDTTEGGYIFVDLATIRKRGDLIKMWVLFDFEGCATTRCRHGVLVHKGSARI